MSEAAATRDRAIDKVFTAVIDDHKLVDKSPDSTMAQSLTSVVDAGGVISRDLRAVALREVRVRVEVGLTPAPTLPLMQR